MLLPLIVSVLLVHPADTLLSPSHVTAFKERVPLEQLASPVSILQADAMTTLGVMHPQGLSAVVPGLLMPEYGASLTSTVYLRGIGSRMENPSMGLYIDGIPVMDKNAYDFDWAMIRSSVLLRGPQAALYGRNSMSGTLVLQSFSPDAGKRLDATLEAGNAETLRATVTASWGRHILSVGARHGGGWFYNVYKGHQCDPYDGLSLHWKWVPLPGRNVQWSNSLLASLSREGGFAYGLYEDGILHPVSYDGEGSYRRLSVLDGLNLHYRGEKYSLDGTASLQLLSDAMRMDQDFTPEPVFTLGQAQNNCTGTLEVIVRDESGSWSRSTGVFAFLRHSGIHAPVTFGRSGIETLILEHANRNIPEDIGFLSIPDDEILIASDFGINTIGAAVFHESVFTTGRWRLTAALRLDAEGARMKYDCLASLHYRFLPTMRADKSLEVPYRGSIGHSSGVQVLPRFSALYRVSDQISAFGTVSRGFRAGGFNTQIFSDILQNETMNAMMKDLGVYLDTPVLSVGAGNTRYQPETAWNYEAGLRLSREQCRVEASCYYMDIRNQQLTVFPPGRSTGRMMTNAGRSRSLGLEVEGEWSPGEFRVHASYAWCDARFLEYDDGNHDYAGNRVPYVPAHTAFTSISWNHPFKRSALGLSAFLKAYGPLYWDEAGTLREPVHLRPGARASLAFARWELYLRGENLAGSGGRNFYFKSVGREFFSRERPASIVLGIHIKF